MNETPFKTIFLINETKIYTKSEGLGVVNYIGLHYLNTSARFASALKLVYFSDLLGIK